MPSRLNQLIVNELRKEFGPVDSCFFLDFTGLTGRKAADLRHQLKTQCGPTASFSIVKNTLARRTFAEVEGLSKARGADATLAGPTAIAYGGDDPILLVRLLTDWGKKNNVLRFKGGILAGHALAPDAVALLARIPPKPVLLAQAIGTAAAPLAALLSVSQGIIRKLIGVVDALAKKEPQTASQT